MTEAPLKSGWVKVKFGEVVRLCTDRSSDPEADGIERYVGLEHLEPEDLRIRRWGLVAEGTTFTSRFKPGQVLFGKRRAYQRKVAVADFEGVCSGDIYIFESTDPKHLLPELLPYICQSKRFFEYAVGTSMGSLSPRTNWKHLKDFELKLPSLEEQKNISDVLSGLNAALESYTDAHNSLHSLSFSLVNHSLQKANPKKIFNINDLGNKKDKPLLTGPFGSKLKTKYFQDDGVPVISIGSLQDNGLDHKEFFYLSAERAKDFDSYATEPGDIVFSRVADVGRCHLIGEMESGYIISSNLIRIRLKKEKIRPQFLWLLLRYSTVIRKQIAKITTQAAGRLLVNTKTMSKLSFEIPNVQVQDSILEDFNSIMSGSESLITRIERCKKNISVFRETLVM